MYFTDTGMSLPCSVAPALLGLWVKKVLEYGCTGSGFLRKSMGANGRNGFPPKPTGNFFCSYGNLRTSPETSGSFRENVI